jgi:branched-chain amino acid transport system substrate-binding protein
MNAFKYSIALAAMVASVLPGQVAAQTSKPWLIGQVVSLTGPAASVGNALDKVAKMWVEEVNAAGGIKGRKVEMTTCNEESKAEKAVACAREMIDNGAVIIIGNTLTASLHAMLPLVRRGPTLLIPSPNVVPAPDTFAFQVSPSDEYITESVANYMKASGLTKIGMVAATDASGEVGVASARKVFPAYGIELKLERIDLRATDATTQLASIAGDDIKLVYSSYSGAGAVTVVKSYKNLGLQQPLIVSYANISQAFAALVKDVKPPRLLGTAAMAIVPDALKDPGEKARSKAFMAAYAKRYSEPADMLNMLGKASMDVADAILRNVPDPGNAEAVKAYLESHVVESVLNQRFSPKTHVGVDASSVIIVELKDGAWVPAALVK